jgi:hypothetical protein
MWVWMGKWVRAGGWKTGVGREECKYTVVHIYLCNKQVTYDCRLHQGPVMVL